MLRVPVATYRIQFNAAFTFQDAKQIVAYLADLGITDIYASPILKARKGSAHGYDVVDASALNPELGSEDDFTQLHDQLETHKLGLVLDIVPNHMAVGQENSWWMSVLENGRHSRYLHYFDIDWNPVTSRGRTEEKVLLPILGKPYGETLEAGEIKLDFDADGFFFMYYDNRLPLAPKSYRQVLRECVQSLPQEGVAVELRDLIEGDDTVPNSRFLKETLWRIYEQHPEFKRSLDDTISRFNGEQGKTDTFNALDALLDSQAYRLAYWRLASEKINYRRFFDVTDLVGVRIEHPEVFEARNRRTLELVAEGKVTGLRIDHIDGLFEPIGHMKRLQLRLATSDSPLSRFYIVLEKILAKDETLPQTFEVSGTTGYDFLDTLNALFVDPAGLRSLTQFYEDFTGITTPFEQICYDRKKQVISELFPGEMRALGKKLGEISMRDRNARDFTPSELLAALVEITAAMKVYRTYIRDSEPVSDEDRRRIREAVAEARERASSTLDARLFRFLESVLLVEPPSYLDGEREKMLSFVMRWQQFTGRVMAKGVEDTAFYNYNRLISLNEVGGDPGRSGDFDPLAEFHARNERIQRDWPDTMNATSTHDTKRSEDVRARINVLSEIPEEWADHVRRWAETNLSLKSGNVPDANEELLIYQTLIGMWPIDEEELDTVPGRLREYLEKASREAKTHTTWINPNAAYEKQYLDFVSAILGNQVFRSSFLEFQRRTSFHGFLNALSQVVLKMTSPGLPDFYQGTEVWDFSLVDPDNRRPVDYESRKAMLKKMKAGAARGSLDIATMIRRWFDGRIKMYVTWKTLELRAQHRDVFRSGGYRALRSESPNVVAFLRGDNIAVAVPRNTTKLVQGDDPPLGEVWKDASIDLPEGTWTNVFTGDEVKSGRLAEVFARFPVAIMFR